MTNTNALNAVYRKCIALCCRHVSETITLLVPVLANLTLQLDKIDWLSKMKLSEDGQLVICLMNIDIRCIKFVELTQAALMSKSSISHIWLSFWLVAVDHCQKQTY